MSKNILRRTLLYVPGSSQKYLDKSRHLTADCVAYDLEDSVTPARKEEARILVRRALDLDLPPPPPPPQQHHGVGSTSTRERAVRINSVSSGLAEADLRAIASSPNLTTIVVPKVDSPNDLVFISDVLADARSRTTPNSDSNSNSNQKDIPAPISILALIESARSLTSLPSITTTTTPLPHPSTTRLSGLIFAAEGFALDLSLTRTPSLREFLFARSSVVTASRAANLPSTIDLVCPGFRSEADYETLEEECRDGKGLGFNGKQCIHPGQLAVVNRGFSPEVGEVEWAVRIGVAQCKAEERGRGAWALDGKMVDRPVEARARAILERAEACGFDVRGVRERVGDQEPD